MTREEIIEYWRLENLRQGSLNNMFCPKCGSQLNIILNGFFHGQLFYCPHEKLIFNLDLKNITKSSSVEFLEYCNKEKHIYFSILLCYLISIQQSRSQYVWQSRTTESPSPVPTQDPRPVPRRSPCHPRGQVPIPRPLRCPCKGDATDSLPDARGVRAENIKSHQHQEWVSQVRHSIPSKDHQVRPPYEASHRKRVVARQVP